DVLEAVEDIPVHIGAIPLKKVLFACFELSWLRYTGFPIKIDDIVIQCKDWTIIEPKDSDSDAISKDFYKKVNNRGVTFKGGQCIIYFHLPNKIYNQYLHYCKH
ncbi:hypothetical protein C0993_007855, partial [Termitomyces sp. T159_Od127]